MMRNFSETYVNPVYPKSFPDPFILKFRGEYYAYCTDFWKDGKVFGILRSRDLVNWVEIGGAMKPLEYNPPYYWAPEVVYSNGKFYLYYSVGNETLMEIRVAVSNTPDGGFIDSGKRLTFQDFAIDAHVFIDEDGQKYLFYATDFLDHSHIGTGTVVERMSDFFTLEGDPRPVTRAKYDWQLYDENRVEKGGVRWHTVEGAFILKRKGIFYEMFSGGNWQNISYGVSFAATDDINRNIEWEQFSDGEKILPILRTIPEKVIGPGHNSVIRGVNNREIYCVYHRWTENGRVLAVDRMDFTGGARIFIKGATTTPQPKPCVPEILDLFDDFDSDNWQISKGSWKIENNQIISGSKGFSELLCRKRTNSFLLETDFCLLDAELGYFGILLKNEDEEIFQLCFFPHVSIVVAKSFENGTEKVQEIPLSKDFDLFAYHLLQIETDHLALKIKLDGLVLQQIYLRREVTNFSFFSENCSTAFSSAALTLGFESLFELDDLSLRGWKQISDTGFYAIQDKNLVLSAPQGSSKSLQRVLYFQDYELTFNSCFLETFGEDFRYGFRLSVDGQNLHQTFTVERLNNDWIMKIEDNEKMNYFLLPDSFSKNTFHQFSFIKTGKKMHISMEAEDIWTVAVEEDASNVGFFVQNASVAFDMIRITGL